MAYGLNGTINFKIIVFFLLADCITDGCGIAIEWLTIHNNILFPLLARLFSLFSLLPE